MAILTYFKLGAVGVAVLLIGTLYIQKLHLTTKLHDAQIKVEVAEANLKVAEKTIKLLKEYQDVDQVIENAGDDDVAEYLRTGVWPKSHPKTGDSPAAAPGQPQTGKPGQGQ